MTYDSAVGQGVSLQRQLDPLLGGHAVTGDGAKFRVTKVTPTVGAAGGSDPRGSSPGSGDTPPTTTDIRALEGQDLSRRDLEGYGHLEWQGDKRAVLHAGGMTFDLKLEPRG